MEEIILKRTEEWRTNSEEEAEALIRKAKEDPDNEGYELTSYSSTRKEKKDDLYYIVKLVKVW
jgi:hypothetical protein